MNSEGLFGIIVLCVIVIVIVAGFVFSTDVAPQVNNTKPFVFDSVLRIVCIPYSGYRQTNEVTCFQLATQEDIDHFRVSYPPN